VAARVEATQDRGMIEKFHVNLPVGGEPCRAELVPRFARLVGVHHIATAPVLATVRGSASRRVIEPGDVFGPEDGDLVVTTANLGAAIPTCSVSFAFDDGAEARAIASALFGWLP
jgi:hypothetical protein